MSFLKFLTPILAIYIVYYMTIILWDISKRKKGEQKEEGKLVFAVQPEPIQPIHVVPPRPPDSPPPGLDPETEALENAGTSDGIYDAPWGTFPALAMGLEIIDTDEYGMDVSAENLSQLLKLAKNDFVAV